jgi:type 1 fimbria pilin
MKFIAICAKATIPCLLLVAAVYMAAADAPSVTVKGYVLDSACAFTKDLSKPISKQCATSCANAGSQLVILAEDGTISTGPSPARLRPADKIPSSFRLPPTKSS